MSCAHTLSAVAHIGRGSHAGRLRRPDNQGRAAVWIHANRGIWLFAGYYFTTRMGELEQRSTAINSRYMRAQDLLTETRGHVLMGSIYVRDALLDPAPKTAAAYRVQLEESYRAADKPLSQYVPVLDVPGEQERIARLRREVDVIRISEQVQALNRTAFVQQQNEIAALYRLTQRHVWESFGLAVAASLGIAVCSRGPR
jgi:hypothetical protein